MLKDSSGTWLVQRSAEVSYMHFEIVDKRSFIDARSAADYLVRSRWPVHIDGIPLIWST
jgi:hypothetical protein